MSTESRDRIDHILWDEFVQAKSWEQTISDYSSSKLDKKKWFNVITAALVIVGSSTWSFWKIWDADWITPTILLLVGIAQILSSTQKYIIVDNETILSLAKLRAMYINYTNKLERLVVSMLENQISKEDLEQQYFALRETVYPMEELKDSLNIITKKKLDKRVKDRVDHYLKERYLYQNAESQPQNG